MLSSSIPIVVYNQRLHIRRHINIGFYPTIKIDADPSNQKVHLPKKGQGWFLVDATDFKRFPFNNFTYCLTLFPKFFSSFPHGTCSLSVSRLCLALDGIYHPFWAAFPNNSTLWERITLSTGSPCQRRDSHPLWRSVPRDLYTVQHGKHFSRLQLGRSDRQILNLSFSHFTRSY
jgi:hypothetical protein